MRGTVTHYGWIDVAKLLMSFVVISVHVGFVFPSCGDLLDLSGHASVPVFLVISGFFFGWKYIHSSLAERGAVVRKYAKRIFVLYVVWTLVYAPIALLYLQNHHDAGIAFLLYLRNVLFVGQNMMSWHLWYLHALIVSLLIIHALFVCRFRMWMVVGLCLLLFCAGLYVESADNCFTETYRQLLPDTQNGIFRGALYVSLGMVLAAVKDKVHWVLYVLPVILSFVSYMFGILVYYPLFAFGFVGLLLSLPHQGVLPSFVKWASKASTFLYLFHFLPIVFLQQIVHWNGNFQQSYIIVLPACLLVAWVWIRLSEVRGLSFMKRFY